MLALFLIIFIIWKMYEYFYYRSEKFIALKKRVEVYIKECNELNIYIEKLKSISIGVDQLDYGKAQYYDDSVYNFKRPEFKKQKYMPNIYNCSRVVCDNAKKQPFKYICKYFNIKAEEENLVKFENILNNFEAVEEGKGILKNEHKRILDSISDGIPFLIRKISRDKLNDKLGFDKVDFSTVYFPKYIFSYISSGGNSSLKCEIVMNIDNLNRFIQYLSGIIKFRKSIAGQRALMTSSLRRKILEKDRYTCRYCKNSVYNEPNLLLEIDHIIPLAQGGVTSEDNLQTLCWKCNRSKGSRITSVNKKERSDIASNIVIKQHKERSKENRVELETMELDFDRFNKDKFEIKEDSIAKDEVKKMYDKEKGIYPAGQYLVGRDIPIGGYLLIAKNEDTAYVHLYPSYNKYKKEEDAITYESFKEDYHIPLMEENTFLVVENADIHKV